MGKRDGGLCDIYWHGVSYYENPDIIMGRVNKFPGKGLTFDVKEMEVHWQS